MSIFDAAMGNTTSLADATLKLLGDATSSGDGKSNDASAQYYAEASQIQKENRILGAMGRGQMSLPYMQGREFTASKSKPAEQTDSETVNSQWLQRLNRYSTIPQVVGAKEK